VVLTGNPVRQGILDLTQEEENVAKKSSLTVLILGGSQGAHRVNELASEALILFYKRSRIELAVIHQTGAADEETIRIRYQDCGITAQVAAFFTDMPAMYRQADFLVSRAGATTLAELAVLGKPAILIPYPYAADNHQEKNARHYCEGGGALMFVERDLTETVLADTVEQVSSNRNTLREMATAMNKLAYPRAAEEIVDVCLQLVADR
jgi:UDP-N-acetylglucosamine--N-acetylmuramyl-(pentapeptide) pyrophosphoryl-undecaprenol N-acetylglucosamine transferase